MKKSKILLISICALLIGVLACTMTGCLKIGMRERNIQKRLEDAGGTITQERTAPMFREASSNQLVGVGTILYCYMNVADVDAETGETVEHEDMLYVIFGKTDEAGDWIEETTQSWLKAQQDKIAAGEELDTNDVDPVWDIEKWNIYRYDNVIMCGHFRILAVARTY